MKPRILFVDDEPAVRDGWRRMLHAHRASWDMDFAENADDALRSLSEVSYEAVVTDVKMPGSDGFELLAAIRGDTRLRDIPVIIVTGAHEADFKRRALNLGAADLLCKPVQAEDLVARLRSVLRLKAQQDALRRHNELLEQKVADRTAELAESRLQIIWRLGKAAEFRDQDTGNHVARVGCFSRVIAETLGLDRQFVELIFLASPLHDIGKIGIPDRILLKQGPLDAAEWAIMKRHCAIGAEILRQDFKLMHVFREWRQVTSQTPRQSPLLDRAVSIALTHHERWDGAGYPSGLAGEDIPLESRIVALADVYDALCSARPYKAARQESEALEIIRRDVGSHFDPAAYAAFDASLEQLRGIREDFADEIPGAAVEECIA